MTLSGADREGSSRTREIVDPSRLDGKGRLLSTSTLAWTSVVKGAVVWGAAAR